MGCEGCGFGGGLGPVIWCLGVTGRYGMWWGVGEAGMGERSLGGLLSGVVLRFALRRDLYRV